MESKLSQKLNEYADKFDDSFPIFSFRHKSTDEIIKMIETCISSGKPCEFDEKHGKKLCFN